MQPQNACELLGTALGLEQSSRWREKDRSPGSYLRYVWCLTNTDGWFGSASLMVAGFEVSDEPSRWRPCSPRWRAALASWFEDRAQPIITAELTSDPVVSLLTAVHWCHLGAFGFPPYGLQCDGTRFLLHFWTAENAGMSVNVEFLSSGMRERKPIERMWGAAVELADHVARTSDDEKFRNEIATCFPGAGAKQDPTPAPQPAELAAYADRVRKWWLQFPEPAEHEIELRARDLWSFGITETEFRDLLPDYPPELTERLLPLLRRLRKDAEM
ncbi:MAG: hypothetical protein J0I06_04145 [Planctomycetes bacterium]|nr:hypothetical protein [Planctomycetota bacterium]